MSKAIEARTYEEALAWLHEHGFDVLEALKGDVETREIPVVIYTSQKLDSEERDRLRAAVDIVPKENASRDVAASRFAEALARAGLPTRLNSARDAHAATSL